MAYQEVAAIEKREKMLNFPPRIRTDSTDQSIALAKKIVSSEIDGKLYGAYWCSHCNNQKQLFGMEAHHPFHQVAVWQQTHSFKAGMERPEVVSEELVEYLKPKPHLLHVHVQIRVEVVTIQQVAQTVERPLPVHVGH